MSTRTVQRSTILPVSAELAWGAVKQIETFAYVARGTNGYRGLDTLPSPLRPGAAAALRLVLLNIFPAWTHHLRIEGVDDRARALQSREGGGPIRRWDHLIQVEPLGPDQCRYTDRVEIEAGPLTPLIWAYAGLFYRYRQWRWQRLARRLAAGQGVPPLRRAADPR